MTGYSIKQEVGQALPKVGLVFLLGVFLAGSPVLAESGRPFPFPEGVLIYGSIENNDQLKDILSNSSLNRFLRDPNMVLWKEKSLPKILGIIDTMTGVNVDAVLDQLTGSVGYAVWDLEVGGEKPTCKAALALGVSGDGGELLEIVNTSIPRIMGSMEAFTSQNYEGVSFFEIVDTPVCYGLVGPQFVITFGGPEAFQSIIDVQQGKRPGIETSAFITEAGAQVPKVGTSFYAVDVEKIMSLITPALPTMAPSILTALSVPNLDYITGWTEPNSVGPKTVTRLTFKGPKDGIFTCLDGKPGRFGSAALVDPEIDTYLGFTVEDWNLALDGSVGTAAKIAGLAAPMIVNQGLEVAGQASGFDLRQDLFAGLGKETAISLGTRGIIPSIQVYLAVKDRDALERVFVGLGTRLYIDYQDYSCGDLTYKVGESAVIPVRFAYAFVNGYLVLSLDESAMRQTLRIAKDAGKSLGESPAYKERIAALGETGILVYSDPIRKLKQGILVLNVLMNIGLQNGGETLGEWIENPMEFSPPYGTPLAKMKALGLSVHDIPNLYILSDYLTPGIFGVRSEGNSIEMITFSGESLLNSLPVAGIVAAVAVPIVMNVRMRESVEEAVNLSAPGFGEAETRGGIARDVSDMRNLALGMEIYYIDCNTYPIPMDENLNFVEPDSNGVYTGYIPTSLTTPIEYLASLPQDVYGSKYSYRYSIIPQKAWIMGSPGPDGVWDGDISDYLDPNGAAGDLQKFLSSGGQGGTFIIYDSSNGTTSSGDIIRTGP